MPPGTPLTTPSPCSTASPQMTCREPGLCERPAVQWAQTGREVEVCERVSGRHQPSVRDLEPRSPRVKANLRPPHRSDENQPLFVPAHTGSPAEAEKPASDHRGTGFLDNLAPQRVDPGLTRLRSPTRQAPPFTVIADQDNLITGEADRRRTMGCSRWRVGRRVPSHPPILAVHAQGHLDAVRGNTVHCGHLVQ
jgi:hypothetical protein